MSTKSMTVFDSLSWLLQDSDEILSVISLPNEINVPNYIFGGPDLNCASRKAPISNFDVCFLQAFMPAELII